jgi:hypothetical protein
MYIRGKDCWNRVIRGPANARFEVLERVSNDPVWQEKYTFVHIKRLGLLPF